MGFVFYDVETTGKIRHFEQILQFAAIHTDPDLHELDRFEVRCRLIPHVVPAPGALAVTRVPIDRLLDPTLPTHYEMICQIAPRLTAWAPAIFLGWNSLDFDEHMLRQALYQCLHSPYLTNTEGSSRTDLMKVAQALAFLQPDAMNVPIGANGKQTFKLGLYAAANGVEHGHAHDAMSDVEATVNICRLIRDRAPEHWSEAVRFSQKAAAAAYLEDETAVLITEVFFGKPYQYALAKIGVDSDNPNRILAFDLEVDPDKVRPLSGDALVTRLGQKVKPVRGVRINASPLLHPIDTYETFHGLTPAQLLDRAEKLRADTEFCAGLCAALPKSEYEASEHIEAQIYAGFSEAADRARMEQFHASNWPGRAAIVEMFDDIRLIELGRRLVYYHSPEGLNPQTRSAMEAALARRMMGHGAAKIPWTTLAAADAEAVAMLASCTEEEAAILHPLRAYFASEMERCKPFLVE